MDLRKIKGFFILSSVMILMVIYSCKRNSTDLPYVEDCEQYDYHDCNTAQPIESKMILNFSVFSKIRSVPFEVYKGYVDEQNLYFRDTAWDASVEYQMPVNEYWSVVAIYHIDGKTIKVIDGGMIKTQSANVCDSTCWSVNELELDVTIK